MSQRTARNNITGNNEANFLQGGSLNDTLKGLSGNDTLWGLSGPDALYGGNGDDRLLGGASNDTLYGNTGNDVLRGGTHADKLYGGGGQDVLTGEAGSDKLYGGGDNDDITGDAGNDKIYGESGDDTLTGGAGNDKLYGSYGTDELNGDAGDDFFVQTNNTGQDTLNGGEGFDTADYRQTSISTALIVNLETGGVDYNDKTDFLDGIERVYGSSGATDTLSASSNSSGVMINLQFKSMTGTGADFTDFSGFEFAIGGTGNDALTGDQKDNQLSGSTGNDTLVGGAGDDSLLGGGGNDTYTNFSAGFGSDSVTDSSGTDTLVLSNFALDDVASWSVNEIGGDAENVIHLLIAFNSGEHILINGYFDDSTPDVEDSNAGTGCIESIQLSDATLDFDDILALLAG